MSDKNREEIIFDTEQAMTPLEKRACKHCRGQGCFSCASTGSEAERLGFMRCRHCGQLFTVLLTWDTHEKRCEKREDSKGD